MDHIHFMAVRHQLAAERGRWRSRRVEAANRSLTVAAPNLVPEFSATFDTNLMMQVLNP